MNAERPDEAIDEAAEDAQASASEKKPEDEATEQPVDPEAALAEAESKAGEHWDRYLRTAAELENVRKRAARDVENAHKFALERFGKELLAVRDSLEMGLSAAENASVESLLEGSTATLKMLGKTMQNFGIEVVDPSRAVVVEAIAADLWPGRMHQRSGVVAIPSPASDGLVAIAVGVHIVRNSVAEILLVAFRAHVRKRQHGDRGHLRRGRERGRLLHVGGVLR